MKIRSNKLDNSYWKILLLIIVLNLVEKTSQASTCIKDNMCMACNSSTINHCDTCFNWGSGSKLARSLNTSVNYLIF